MKAKDVIPYIKLIQLTELYKPKLENIKTLDDNILYSLTSYLQNNFLNEYKFDIKKSIDNQIIVFEINNIVNFLDKRERNPKKFLDSLSNIETESKKEIPPSINVSYGTFERQKLQETSLMALDEQPKSR